MIIKKERKKETCVWYNYKAKDCSTFRQEIDHLESCHRSVTECTLCVQELQMDAVSLQWCLVKMWRLVVCFAAQLACETNMVSENLSLHQWCFTRTLDNAAECLYRCENCQLIGGNVLQTRVVLVYLEKQDKKNRF